MIMTSVLGHVKELNFTSAYSDWQAVPYEELFVAPVVAKVPSNMRDVAENLELEARRAHMLIIWTDCDREGEYIGSEICQICITVNPRLDVFRARYSVLNVGEMHKAMRNLSKLDSRQVAAAELRSEIDLRGGAAFTRLQTISFRNRLRELQDKIISYGSCQFPTLGFVVEQYLKVKNHVEELFWYIHLEIKGSQDAKLTEFVWERRRLFDRPVCLVIYDRCLKKGIARIIKVESKPTSKWRPIPLRTVELQKFGSRFLKLSSDRVMELAEKLYNQGFISYPRTETDMFEPSFDLRSLISQQTGNEKWGAYAKALEEGRFCLPRKGKNNDKAHPPIHPTKDGSGLMGSEAKVYEFITRRFLACCSDDAKGLETITIAQIGEELFKARGILVEALNFLEVYIYENWNNQSIGHFRVNDQLEPSNLEMLQGITTAPKLLSESELIGTMDKNGIGTDATIHEHIKKIIERSYVIKTSDSRFHPTNFGLALVKGYDKIGLEESLTKPKLRAMLEQSLMAIYNGSKTKDEICTAMLNRFRDSLRLTMQKIETIYEELSLCASLGLFEPAPLLHNSKDQRRRNRRQHVGNNESDHSDDDKLRSDGDIESNGAFGQGPFCLCARPTSKKITKKAGPNRGKAFWGCTDCNFFMWVEDEHKVLTTNTDIPKTTLSAADNSAFCNCGKPAVYKKVIKDGSNKGRSFAICAQPKEQACSFFAWIDEQNHSKRIEHNVYNKSVSKFGHERKCNCDMEAVREVTRSGSNAGRAYFRCSKVVQKCGFFQWEEDHGSTSDRSVKERNFSISCYRCGINGHFANACPEKEPEAPIQRAKNRARYGRGSRGRGGKRRKEVVNNEV